jgi:hypothetical protein
MLLIGEKKNEKGCFPWSLHLGAELQIVQQ